MNWEPSARGSAAEMLESVSTDSRHSPQVRGARFAEGGGRFTGMPRMTLRLRYRVLKPRALCWVLRRLRAQARPWFPGVPTRSELNVRPGKTRSRFAELRLARRIQEAGAAGPPRR